MKFKKHISILTAFLILVSNSGLAFSVHFCDGKIASISSVFSSEEVCEMTPEETARLYPAKEEKTCCAKIEPTHKKCCSDKKVDLKNKTEKIIIKSVSLDFEPAYFYSYKDIVFAEVKTTLYTDKPVAFYCDSNAPPLYQLYCQYTFYA